jgi:hypothetical protein
MASKKLHRAATTVVTYRLPASSVCSCMSSTPKRRTAESLVFVNAIFADLVTIVDDRADAVGAAERRCDRRSIVGPT